MKFKYKHLSNLLLFAGLLLHYHTSISQKLSIGDKAPPLTIQSWLQGPPTPTFKKGHVYVVEFTAINCSPCIKAIPHLMSLAQQYSESVTIISVFTIPYLNSREKDPEGIDHIKKINEILTYFGDKVHYTVAVDVRQKKTQKTWGINAVPAIFIINRSGNIEWMGSPFEINSLILDQIIAQTFDAKSVLQQQIQLDNCIEDIFNLKREGNSGTALNRIDSLITVHPTDPTLYNIKFKLLSGDDDACNNWLEWLLNSEIENLDWARIFSYTTSEIKNPNDNLAFLAGNKAFSETPRNLQLGLYNIKANLYIKKSGNAISWEQAKDDLHNASETFRQALEHSKSIGELEQAAQFEDLMFRFQYKSLVGSDDKKADSLLRWLVRTKSDQQNISWEFFLNTMMKHCEYPNYDLALKMADASIAQVRDAKWLPPLTGSRYGRERFEADAIRRKGKILAAKGDLQNALLAYQEALKISSSTNDIQFIEDSKEQLSEFKRKYNL